MPKLKTVEETRAPARKPRKAEIDKQSTGGREINKRNGRGARRTDKELSTSLVPAKPKYKADVWALLLRGTSPEEVAVLADIPYDEICAIVKVIANPAHLTDPKVARGLILRRTEALYLDLANRLERLDIVDVTTYNEVVRTKLLLLKFQDDLISKGDGGDQQDSYREFAAFRKKMGLEDPDDDSGYVEQIVVRETKRTGKRPPSAPTLDA